MSVGTRVDSTVGPNVTANTSGLQVAKDATNHTGFLPFKVDSVTAFVSTSAGGNTPTAVAGHAGVCTLSGSGAILTLKLPTAALAIGSEFIFRNVDARAHILSNSAETGGTLNIVSGATVGTKITMAAVVDASVVFKSDGKRLIVIGGFGNNPVT